MRILFLNQFFPPDPAPTGILLHELGLFLRERGHDTEFVAAAQDYRSGQKGRGRVVRELTALSRIFRAGLAAKKPDVIFACSSPPGLPAVGAVLAKKHRARFVHWAMDLYPELALTLGEVGPRVASAAGLLMKQAYRAASLVVGLDEDMQERLARYGIRAEAIRPWLPQSLDGSPHGTRDPKFVWMYSGNLGRAHDWKTLLDVQAKLERRGRGAVLRFQGGGAHWPAAQAYAAEIGLRHCEWQSYVPEAEVRSSLLRASALVATQNPETQGLLWPSKLALAFNLQRPMLFIGPAEGAIARKLSAFPHAGVFPPGASEQIVSWLEDVMEEKVSAEKPLEDAGEYRQAALQEWTRLLERLLRA